MSEDAPRNLDDASMSITFDELYASISTLFRSLGRGLLCLDRELRVVHVSEGIDSLVGEEVSGSLVGRPVADVLGADLFGPGAPLRAALERGELREGWGATLQASHLTPRQVSITCAPLRHEDGTACDPRVSYVVIVRPRESVEHLSGTAPVVFSGIVARSAAMLRIFRLVENLEESEATVLIEGESGTGKELVARAIHVHSPRRNRPFVPVNCGALPGELLESELFGHVRGAFTGAVRDREGRFKRARGGTLFLDEVGEIPLHLQVKLLRVLQERTFEPVGSSATEQSDARIIAATNQDLRKRVSDGAFREDLFYRLRVVPITVPPLRMRREDIEPLARHLLARVGSRYSRSMLLAPEALRDLLRYDWPGNVRELENALEYAVALASGQTIHRAELPPEISGIGSPPPAGAAPAAGVTGPAGEAGARGGSGAGERERILAALEASRWRREEAARRLGMSRSTLWRRMRELEIGR